MKIVDLTDKPWQVWLPEEAAGENGSPAADKKSVMLPGTLDQFGIGHTDRLDNSCHPDEGTAQTFDSDGIATRFTRKYTYEGPAYFNRKTDCDLLPGKRVFLEIERARCLRLSVDGKEIEPYEEESISTPHVFELTEALRGKKSAEILIVSDNSYPGLPHDAIVYSSAATDETQTNWNGLLGYIRLREENEVFLSQVRVYPKDGFLRVEADVDAAKPFNGSLRLESSAFQESCCLPVHAEIGKTTIIIDNIPLAEPVQLWDEYCGKLYQLAAVLETQIASKIPEAGQTESIDKKVVCFGVRSFRDDKKGHLALNGRRIFLRSEANCAEFPETGYIPMEKEAWKRILKTYQDYGVNMVRFHSHCPPEAAFEAADEMGILMQPELSHWDPKHAFESEESYRYYETELRQIIKQLANHPSFVMLTFGNELHCGRLGTERMHQLLARAREQDSTRLYANASNAHYGNEGCDEESDFYASQSYYNYRIRGTLAGNPETPEEAAEVERYEKEHKTLAKVTIKGYINNQYPNAKTCYDETLAKIRETYQKPVFSFEVGQFEVLPDFDELAHFHGISDPANYQRIQRMVRAKGLEKVWKRYVEATGELSRLCYREEIEAALRTEELSGISLLGLQDFPGQGTALVGMLDSHLEPKPFDFARPERFQAFFRQQLPLCFLEKYTYDSCETLTARIRMANYARTDCTGKVQWRLTDEKGQCAAAGEANERKEVCCPAGGLSEAGSITVSLEQLKVPARYDLTVLIGESANTYPIWVYTGETPGCPEGVYETAVLDEAAKQVLESGEIVYYSPASVKESFGNSIRAQFSTDFWSVGTFGRQEGAMGQLIDQTHPIFREFPTESHTNWQWWPMANQRAVILPGQLDAIITEMDSYAFLRPMAQLFECRVGNGKLLYSTLGLGQLQQYPEGRALQRAIYRYLSSAEFAPRQELAWETVRKI